MEVTYNLTGEDRMWIVARDWLAARPAFVRRCIEGVAVVALLPLLLAALIPALRHFILAVWIVDALLVLALVGVVVSVARQFFGPFLSALNDPLSATISIGPEVLVESMPDPIAIPWEYIRAVWQDPVMVYIVLDTGVRHAIPRSAFSSYAASWRFGSRAVGYWRRAHPAPKTIRRSRAKGLANR